MLPSNKTWSFMRSEVQRFMQDTVTIVSGAITRDRYGVETKVYSVVASGVKAQISDASGSEKQLIAAIVNEGTDKIETCKLGLPYGTTINTDNEILTDDNKYWQIVSTNSSQSFTAVTQCLLYRHIRNSNVVP